MRTIIMKLKWNSVIIIAALVASTLGAVESSAQKKNDEQLLQVRETVWRAWFAGDTKTLEELVPPESVVMSGETRTNGRTRPMCFTVQRNFTPRAESLSDLNSLALKFSTSAMSPSFGVSIWPRRKQTANARSIPAVSPRFLYAATDNGPIQAGTPTREDDPPQAAARRKACASTLTPTANPVCWDVS
jgi:hypothetical protein